MSDRYAADPPSMRIVVPLDELTALYHRRSGATHLLASPAPELLDALAQGPADAEALLARLSEHYDLPDATSQGLTARLDELVATGLAWRA